MFENMDAYKLNAFSAILFLVLYVIRFSTSKKPNKLKLVKMKIVNEKYWFETLIDENKFILQKETETEMFGYYNKIYVVIKKKLKK